MARQQSCLLVLFKMVLMLVLLVAGIIAAFFFLSDQMRTFLNRGDDIVVPDFRGQHLMQVFNSKPRELGIERGQLKYSSGVPRDHVIEQDPPPGTRVKQGKQVVLTISLGGKQVTAPDLIGKDLRHSSLAILNAQLREGTRIYLPSADVPLDRVITQYPWPNTQTEIGTPVDLMISLGPGETRAPLPNLVGQQVEEVKGLLVAWGLRHGRISTRTDRTQPAGVILASRPRAFEPVNAGEAVDLLVSSGDQPGNATADILSRFELRDPPPPSPAAAGSSSGLAAAVPVPPVAALPPVRPVALPGADGPPPAPAIMVADDGEPGDEPGDRLPPSDRSGGGGAAAGRVPIRFVMPDGFMPKEVKFILVSPAGRQVVYEGVHKPNEAIRAESPVVPGGRLQIYINSIFIEERPL